MKKSLIALAFGTLGLGMAEFVMMGVLSDIAQSLSITIPAAGHFISAYALGVCAGAPLLLMMARKRPLRQILLLMMAVYTVGNLCTALAPNYVTLLAMRFFAGLPHGAYFGVAAIAAGRLADKGKASSAVAVMVSGMTFANLLGVPLGTYLANVFSWRVTFLLVGFWGIVVLIAIARWLPYLNPLPDNGFKGQFRFLKTLPPWLLITATMLGNAGFFCYYSYITPLMTQSSGFSMSDMSALMVLAGLGMVLGNAISGKLSDRYTPALMATSTQGALCAILLSIFFFAQIGVISALLMFLATLCLFAFSTPQQVLIIQNSKGGEMMGGASVQIAFNLGNAVGAYVGGLPIAAGYSYPHTALLGLCFGIFGFLALLYYSKRFHAPQCA